MGILKEILKTTVFIPVIFCLGVLAHLPTTDTAMNIFGGLWVAYLIGTYAFYYYVLHPSFRHSTPKDDQGQER